MDSLREVRILFKFYVWFTDEACDSFFTLLPLSSASSINPHLFSLPMALHLLKFIKLITSFPQNSELHIKRPITINLTLHPHNSSTANTSPLNITSNQCYLSDTFKRPCATCLGCSRMIFELVGSGNHEHIILECPHGHQTPAKSCPCEIIDHHPRRHIRFKVGTGYIGERDCEKCQRNLKLKKRLGLARERDRVVGEER